MSADSFVAIVRHRPSLQNEGPGNCSILRAGLAEGAAMAEVLLTGATGFLGQHVLRELLLTGTKVRALSRSAAGDALLRGLGAEPVRADVTDADAVRAAMTGVDAVFHTAADTNTWRPNNDSQTRTNVGGAQNLLAAAKANNVIAFLHTSSISAYSHLVHGVL